MTLPEPDALGRTLDRIAVEAARVILPHWRIGVAVDAKRDGSPMTAADRASEAVILQALAEAFPDIPVVSEEGFEQDGAPHSLGARFFLVDPLDGTRGFVAGRDAFVVNIGLIEDGRPVAGAIAAPARGVVWSTAGTGVIRRAFDEADGRLVRCRPRPADGGVALVSHSLSEDEARALAGRFDCPRWRALDSALKFCLIAEGDFDCYPRTGRTMEWDTAAGEALIRAAGGGMTGLDGQPMRYGCLDRGLVNPGFIARGG